MEQLPYFPFGEQFDLRMGIAAFRPEDRLVETDEAYAREIALKRRLLAADHRYYYQSAKGTEPAQWEVLELVLNDLVRFDPVSFQFDKKPHEWRWMNRKTNEETVFTPGKSDTLAFEPLDWVGRQVQEDLVLLGSDEGSTLIAGQLCFANGYSLDDKYGHSFLGIHGPAPKMIGPTMGAAQKLMEKIQAGRPVWRASWNFKISDELDLSSRHNARYKILMDKIVPELTAETIGPKLFIRIERQTLTRLPVSRCILFGIHTYQNTLEGECRVPGRANDMLRVLRTTPRAMLDYKAITPFEEALLQYLEKRV